MRVNFNSVELPMRFANALRFMFPALKLSKAQEWCGQIFGYRNWHELQMTSANRTGAATQIWSPDEVDLNREPLVVLSREELERQRGVLYGLMEKSSDPNQVLYALYCYAREGCKLSATVDSAPLFSVLHKRNWFSELRRCSGSAWHTDFSLSEYGLEGGYSVRGGFKSVTKALHWAKKANHESVEELIYEFKVASGTWNYRNLEFDLPISSFTAGAPFWICGPRNRMEGGLALEATITAHLFEPWKDKLDICVSHVWDVISGAKKPFFDDAMISGLYPVMMGLAEEFIAVNTARSDIERLHGSITIRGEGSERAKVIAAEAAEVALDFLIDNQYSRAGHFLGNLRRG